jgi:hypothetical protein
VYNPAGRSWCLLLAANLRITPDLLILQKISYTTHETMYSKSKE